LALHEFLYGPEGEPRVIKRNGREKVQIGYLTSHSLRDIICSVNGKEKGGKGEGQKADRADFSRFVVNHFRQITVIQRKWAKAAATNPIKRAEMITGLRSLILGELAIIPLTGKSEGVVENEKVLPPWDREFSELMMDLLKERLYKKNRERIDGPELVDNRPQPAHPLLEQEYARAENWE
jgi:hypothetical protein